MGRDSKYTDLEITSAVRTLAIAKTSFNKLSSKEQAQVLTGLFSLHFKKKISKDLYERSVGIIIENYLVEEFNWVGLSNDNHEKIIREEFLFLKELSSRKSVPNQIVNILVWQYSENLHGRWFLKKPDARTHKEKGYEKVLQEVADLLRIMPYNENNIFKKTPIDLLEKIIPNPFYSIDMRALLYSSEKNRLKKTFAEYVEEGLSREPYRQLERLKANNLIFNYIFLIDHFEKKKKNKGLKEINKAKAVFPPKPSEVIKAIKELRGNKDSGDKIYGEITKIFDPGYGQTI